MHENTTTIYQVERERLNLSLGKKKKERKRMEHSPKLHGFIETSRDGNNINYCSKQKQRGKTHT